MSAVPVNTSSTAVVTAKNFGRRITFQNLGPNAIYLARDVAATVAGGVQVAATSGIVTLDVPPGSVVNGITTSAIQATPADTRIFGD